MTLSISILDVKDDKRLMEVNNLPIEYLHLDVMDGKFVLNKTADFDTVKNKMKLCNKKKDVHLMVDDVEAYVEKYSSLKPDFITFHVETKQNILLLIDKIKKLGIKVGLSLRPNTPLETLIPFLDKIDLILLMSVEPGKGGQTFLPQTLERLQKLLKWQKQFKFVLEIDGGITLDVAREVPILRQVDMIVVGSYFTKDDNVSVVERYNRLMETLNDC